ncbi:MAG: NAD(P)/FAD-dependent oxidoreductase [Nitrospinae bacterium]|nr:NAD(P)/FAD-dependent oxidoreductase [Nitrospinota bacterium]
MGRDNSYDAIVVGSGIGGLAAAAALAKLSKRRVLVLERHFQPGGQTHAFARRGRWHFDVGLHYVGQMAPGETARKVMDFLTGGRVAWNRMPETLERFIYPDFTFTARADPRQYLDDLAARFPAEGDALRRYFRDAKNAGLWYGFRPVADGFPRPLKLAARGAYALLGGLARLTTKEYLDRHFRDARLKALLASQWPDYGLPPSQSSFGMHGMVVTHYLKGAWYPEGGAGRIAAGIIPEIERAGGRVRTGVNVTRIIVEGGAATGVAAIVDGAEESFHAPLVISDAGAVNTYCSLLPPEVPVPFRRELAAFPAGSSAFVLYLCLKDSPARLGFDGGNTWVFESYDHEEMFSATGAEDGPMMYFLSFPSLKDPKAVAHTGEVVTMANYDEWKRWAGRGWRKRDREYYAFKEALAQKLLAKAEARFPGFKELVAHYDVSTPLTMEYFQGNPAGAFYGIPCVPHRPLQPWSRPGTPVKNLYLAGADVMSPGIVGAMMGGIMAMAATEGATGMMKVMGKIMRAASPLSQ